MNMRKSIFTILACATTAAMMKMLFLIFIEN